MTTKETIEEGVKILAGKGIKLEIYWLDNPKIFVYEGESRRLGQFKYGPRSLEDYACAYDFVSEVLLIESERYFNMHVYPSIAQASLKLSKDIYNQWKQLDEKGLDLPEEITVNLTLKFPKNHE